MTRGFLALFIALMLVFSLTGCLLPKKEDKPESSESSETSEFENIEYPVSAAGAELLSRPGKAVSLSPSITEKLVELGLSDRIEGISDYDTLMTGKKSCGTAQEPDLDAIEKIAPHILLTAAELSDGDYERIRQMGIQVAVIPRAANIEQLMKNYKDLAVLFEGENTGAALGDAFQGRFRQKLSELGNSGGEAENSKNSVYLVELDYKVATGDTLENELMELIGLNNIAKEQTDWEFPEKEANSAEGRAKFESIDFIFCDESMVTIKDMEKSTFFKGLNAVLKDYYLYIDATAFDCQTMRMFNELSLMKQYANGEIPGSKDQQSAAVSAAA